MPQEKKSNQLAQETSPYLLQHADNPVSWYPWGEEAFAKAKVEDKPVFLSIGYSTCHWCHVMAHESFEDAQVAELLNRSFVAIKVDKEERPDVDSIYMNVCQMLTGSGGWPLTILMTHEQKPFFAGTYFPKHSRRQSVGLIELLLAVQEKWAGARGELLASCDQITAALQTEHTAQADTASDELPEAAVNILKRQFEAEFGGFGRAPKFPIPHNLLFLLEYHLLEQDRQALDMVEKTLLQMYKGGIFDHIGYGFSRYSTDNLWLVPHFEKMLYDNALLTLAYTRAFEVTGNALYETVATRTLEYVQREMLSYEGGFYSAQDADSEGVEGKFYVLTPGETAAVLGEKDAERFNSYYGITPGGNFEGKSIPNLLEQENFDESIERLVPEVYAYRKARMGLGRDDKILTSWNGLMIAAFADAYRVFDCERYLQIARNAAGFIEKYLWDGERLYAAYRDGRRTKDGYLDDYAFLILGLTALYEAAYDEQYLALATRLYEKVVADFFDSENGGFYLYGLQGEQLIHRPKEVYDGAMPSGNSVMAYNLQRLAALTKDPQLDTLSRKQHAFMRAHAGDYPSGNSFYMLALLLHLNPPKEIVCVLADAGEQDAVRQKLPRGAVVRMLRQPTNEYPLVNGSTTYYVCEAGSCRPPVNEL